MLYDWPLSDEFRDREDQLLRLEEWWQSPERMPLALYGRRRVGKSWLMRRFADGKPAVILVAERLATASLLERFAGSLEPILGVRPDIADIPALIRTLYRAARGQRLLAVVDEFPWMLPSRESDTTALLSAIAAVMEEERDLSDLKLVLCGSAVSQMEALFSERNPLYGRLVPLELRPLRYSEARGFLRDLDPVAAFERYAIAGGMPRYLAALGSGDLRQAVCRQVLQPDGPLWNEVRTTVGSELRQPDVYFAILERLSTGEKELGQIAGPLRMDGNAVASYLQTLAQLRLVTRSLPVGAAPSARGGHWRLRDPFVRFWFRFVFPYQAELEAGLSPGDLYVAEVAPALADHVSPEFEEWVRGWARIEFGVDATVVGRWWGRALDRLRRTGERSSEEIDVVAIRRGRVRLVGEAKWSTRPVGLGVLRQLYRFKLPALAQAGYQAVDELQVVLVAKAGFSAALVEAAATDSLVRLVDASTVL